MASELREVQTGLQELVSRRRNVLYAANYALLPAYLLAASLAEKSVLSPVICRFIGVGQSCELFVYAILLLAAYLPLFLAFQSLCYLLLYRHEDPDRS